MIVLAAGSSRRLGRPKQFLRRGGITLLGGRVRLARALLASVPLVVTGARRFAVARTARLAGAECVHNPAWVEGMGSSLARGARAAGPGCALLIMTVDQYRVDARDLRRLLAAWRRRPWRAAAAAYAGVTGVPAIFPTAWRSRLAGLRGDRGAGALLQTAGRRLSSVALPRAAIDVDYPEDWR